MNFILAPATCFLYNAPSLLKKFGLSLVIISRYLIKEVLSSLLGVTLVLLLIFLSNQLVRYLSYAASGKIASHLLLQLMGFEIPYLLALLLPLGLYLGIILAYGRLYADSEMTVLNACGLSINRLFAITSVLAAIVAAVVVMLMLWVNPLIIQEKGREIAQDTVIDTLRPGRFQVIGDGRRVVYVEQISRNRQRANNLFIAEEQKKLNDTGRPSWVVVSAASGYQAKNHDTHDNFIVSDQGYRYEGIPGQNEYKVIQFQKYAVRIPNATMSSGHQETEGIPSAQLWQDYKNPLKAAELQWRFSIGISVLVLMVLAIPLCKVRPRQGRYASLFPAMLIYIIYVNLLFVARNWVEIRIVPIYLGMWWVHVLVLAIGILLLVMQQRYLTQPRRHSA